MGNELLLNAEYVVVSYNGQDGNWFKCFENKDDAERELTDEHYEFGEREVMTMSEFLHEHLYTQADFDDDDWYSGNEEITADDGTVVNVNNDLWIDMLDGYLIFK